MLVLLVYSSYLLIQMYCRPVDLLTFFKWCVESSSFIFLFFTDETMAFSPRLIYLAILVLASHVMLSNAAVTESPLYVRRIPEKVLGKQADAHVEVTFALGSKTTEGTDDPNTRLLLNCKYTFFFFLYVVRLLVPITTTVKRKFPHDEPFSINRL